MSQVSTSFPDQTYSSSNKPSSATLKTDIAAIETAHNETDTYAIRKDGTVAFTADQSMGGNQLTNVGAGSASTDAATIGGTETLTNKTITSPTVTTPTLTLKQSASPTPTAEGDIQWDTDDNKIMIGDGAGTKQFLDKTAMLQAVYPVGSIYVNATDATNPGTLLGFGTWTSFAAGRVMVGLNSSDTDFDTAEETGGAKTNTASGTTGTPSATTPDLNQGDENAARVTTNHTHTFTSSAFSIVQPYITVYMWKRTA